MNNFILNIRMVIPGDLSQVMEYIDEFKKLESSIEFLESTHIQRTRKTSKCIDLDEPAKQSISVDFKIKVPLEIGKTWFEKSTTPNRPATIWTKMVCICLDEFVQCITLGKRLNL